MILSKNDTKDDIHIFQLHTLRKGLLSEIKGMKLSRGKSCYTIIKKRWDLKGNKQRVYEQLTYAMEQCSLIGEFDA